MSRPLLPMAGVFALLLTLSAPALAATGPSFDCGKVEAGSIPAMVCRDAELSALDRKLARVYKAASAKATNEHPPVLKAGQRGWIKGRDDCWKSAEPRACVADAYRLRIAELQATYRLVPVSGRGRYACDGREAKEVIANFFATEPPSAIAEFGDQTSFLVAQPAASGAKYQGRNETLWEHQGKALITWGYGAPEMRCQVKD